MKSIKELNQRKVPIVKINNTLEKYKNLPLFKDKLDRANETLKKVGIPKFKPQSNQIINYVLLTHNLII